MSYIGLNKVNTTSSRLVTGWLVLYCLFAWGCDDAFIDPFKNDGKYYTVYGFLDESKNFSAGARQAFRIIPVTRRAAQISSASDPDADFDGRVFLTDVNLEQTREIPRELRELEPGIWGHIFETQLFVQPNHVYRLEIMRSDGIIASAETRVPATSSMRIVQDMPVANADSTIITQDVRIDGARSLWELDVIYYTGGASCFTASPNTISYGRAGAFEDDMWHLQLNLSEDLATMGLSNANICSMGLRARIVDDQWLFPEGTLNLEALTLPQSLTNVENGYGFFGSMGLFQSDWPLLAEVDALLNSGS
ncbi:MAG: hypothetical protein AAF564_06640 [Bacteroidota bacterium]